MQKLTALERSYVPALDAAQGREREAAAREKTEHDEAQRLATAATAAPSRPAQLELRKQALGATNRELAALETRLVAISERIDATERQLRLRAQRLDAWSRRLDARAERLAAQEQAAAPKPPPAAAEAHRGRGRRPRQGRLRDGREVPDGDHEGEVGDADLAGPGRGAPLRRRRREGRRRRDRGRLPDARDAAHRARPRDPRNMAKLAAKDRCELLIWARAKDPSLMSEAQRRATELQTLVMSAAKLEAGQVVTRITMRPGAQGVDVVVSVLRETAKPAAAAAPAAPAPRRSPAESGSVEIREAVQAAQPAIELCIGDHLRTRKLRRARGTLKLTVSAQGRIVKVTPTGSDLAGDALETCLGRAAATWQFPSADADYVVDVPITVMSGGPAK